MFAVLSNGAAHWCSEQRYSQNGFADEVAQNIARRRHDGARMGIAEQSLDGQMLGKRSASAHPHRRRGDGDSNIACRRLALEYAQHGGLLGALKVIDEIVDARRKPIRIDLHRRKLRAKGWQALSESLAEMLEASPVEMRRGPGRCGAAKAQRDRRRAEVEQRKHDLQHRFEAGAVVGQLQTGRDLAILEGHRRGSVGAHPETIPWAGNQQSGHATGDKIECRIRRTLAFRRLRALGYRWLLRFKAMLLHHSRSLFYDVGDPLSSSACDLWSYGKRAALARHRGERYQ